MSQVARMGRKRMAVGAAVAIASAALLTGPAASAGAESTARVIRTVDVAGWSPYAGSDCNVATPYYTSPGGKEGEPSIAVNPRDPKNRVAVWMDATRATVDVAYTHDKGKTWQRTSVPGIDECTGNNEQPWEASGDPWLSFGPDGTAYLSTLTWAYFVTPPASSYVSVVHVQASTDGGRTWSTPVFVAGHHPVSDKPMVVADPYHAGVAYEIWRNQSFGLPVGDRGKTRLLFAVTDDWGQSWSDPRVIARGTLSDFFGSPQLSVLKGGTLVATSSLANPAGGTDLLSWRSDTHGRTWTGPTTVRTAADGADPAICGQTAAGADAGSSSGQQAVIGGRSVVFVTLDGDAAAAGRGKLLLSRSDNGGRTWWTRTVVSSARPLLLASVAADRHGRLGLVWDEVDMASVDCAAGIIPTQTRFAAYSGDGRALGSEVTVGARWWNMATALRGSGGFSGYFLGDYQSLQAMPGGFTTVAVQGPALSKRGPTPRIHGANGVMVSNVYVQR